MHRPADDLASRLVEIIAGDVSPGSSVTRFGLPVEARTIAFPAVVEPVNRTLSTSG